MIISEKIDYHSQNGRDRIVLYLCCSEIGIKLNYAILSVEQTILQIIGKWEILRIGREDV